MTHTQQPQINDARLPTNVVAAFPATDRRWVVVTTQPHRERYAVENLDRQKFACYCPQLLKTVRHARKTRNVMKPLFPGYVFVQVDVQQQRWQSIMSTYGVRSVVRLGDSLGFLDDGFVASLKAREIDGVVARPPHRFEIGQNVRLSGGAFDNLVAAIIDLDDHGRLVVLMDLLNQRVKVKVDGTRVLQI
jgi:transcriptional antiterminator RfaH